VGRRRGEEQRAQHGHAEGAAELLDRVQRARRRADLIVPNIHAVVDALIDPEARFAFGLEMLVTGIAAQA
jgi:hypothetical protein